MKCIIKIINLSAISVSVLPFSNELRANYHTMKVIEDENYKKITIIHAIFRPACSVNNTTKSLQKMQWRTEYLIYYYNTVLLLFRYIPMHGGPLKMILKTNNRIFSNLWAFLWSNFSIKIRWKSNFKIIVWIYRHLTVI